MFQPRFQGPNVTPRILAARLVTGKSMIPDGSGSASVSRDGGHGSVRDDAHGNSDYAFGRGGLEGASTLIRALQRGDRGLLQDPWHSAVPRSAVRIGRKYAGIKEPRGDSR